MARRDHTLGLPDLIATLWIMGRTVPKEAFGSEGSVRLYREIVKR
jgi:hypothetical protein